VSVVEHNKTNGYTQGFEDISEVTQQTARSHHEHQRTSDALASIKLAPANTLHGRLKRPRAVPHYRAKPAGCCTPHERLPPDLSRTCRQAHDELAVYTRHTCTGCTYNTDLLSFRTYPAASKLLRLHFLAWFADARQAASSGQPLNGDRSRTPRQL